MRRGPERPPGPVVVCTMTEGVSIMLSTTRLSMPSAL
jgi:hypothetical protein